MKTTFDLNAILFKCLNTNAAFKSALTGGVYTSERPDDSEKEDAVINTLTVTREHSPQRGRSNVNIFVPDIKVQVGGKEQRKPAETRMKTLADLAIAALEGERKVGLSLYISNMGVMDEPDIHQHFVNLRVDWLIYTKT